MKGSLIIVSFFIIGTLCGVYHLIPYDFTDSKLSYYALCGLMFCVGISRLRHSGSFYEPAKSFRLYGSWSRIWLLLALQHIYHRI